MAGIFSDVSTDIQKLRQLKAEIENVKKALKGIDVNVKIDIAKGMEAQLQSLMKKYDALVKKVSEAEGKIMSSTKRINDASEKIIKAQEQLSKAAGMNTKLDNGNADVSLNNVGTANVQAQAKAYDELAKEIDSVMGTRSQNIKRMIDEQNAIRLINEEIKKLTKFQTGNSTLTNTQQKRLEQLNNSLLTHKAALSDIRQTLMNNVKLDNSATTSMNGLSQSLSRMRIAYRELTEEERNSPFGKELLASIQQADAKIKELDATIGNHQRNVGNYAKGYNGLNMSVQQIVRELPSAAMGLNMFFLAISNNLPILTDEIKRAKAANEELKVSGQKGVPVWKQVVSSLFSWQSALMVGITLLTVHGDKVWEWAKRIMVGESAAEKMKKTMIELNEIEKNANATQIKTRMELNGIISSIEKFNGTKEQEKQKIDELNSKYGSIFGAYNNLAQWYDVLINKGDAYINSLFAQAKAQSYIQKAIEAEQKIRDIKANGIESYRPTWGAGGKVYQFFGGGKKNQYGSDPAELAYNAALAQAENEKSNALKNAEEAQNTYLNEIKKRGIFDYRTIINKDAERQKKDNQQNLSDEFLQLIRANQQDEINLMEEGSEKKRRQIELDYQKEIDEIKKQRKKWEDAQGGKLTSEQREVLGSRASNAMQSREKGLAEITKAENQAAIEANERYLKSYGTFMQKRDAIIAEYTRKISEETAEGDKKILQKEMEKALSSLDLDKLKQGINWELVFGDLGKVSKESLDKVKQQLKDFKNSEEYRNMAVDQKKVIDEALNNIQTTLIDKGGLLADLPEQLNELAKAQEELAQAQEEYNEAMKNGTDEQKESATKKLNDAQKKQQNAQTNVQKSTDRARSNLVALSNAINELGSSSEASLTSVGNLVSGILDIVGEGGDKISGIIGSIFSLLDNIGSQGLDGFIGNIVSSIAHAAYGAWDTIFGWTGIDFGGESDPHLQDDLERLTISNQDLINSLDNLAEKMDESSVADATDIYEQQKENIREQMTNTQEMMQRSAAAYSNGFLGIGGSHSSNKKINEAMSAEDWKRVSEAAGVSVTSASDFWNLTSEQMYNVANNATDLYSKIKQYADDGYQNASQYMDSYIEYWKQLEELEDAYREKLTDTSFDTVRDEFKNSLLDMESDAEDFAENFEKMMQQAVIESMMSDTYAKRLKEWYKNFANAMEGGELTGTEQADLKAQWDQMVSDALAERDAIMQAMGWDSSSSEQQSASGRGFGTEMTHEDAGELSGRFTAVYESNLRIEAAEQQQTVAITELRGSISALTAQASGIYNIADETRTILANSYLELQQIRENTGEIVKPIKQMQADIAEVKRNTSRL